MASLLLAAWSLLSALQLVHGTNVVDMTGQLAYHSVGGGTLQVARGAMYSTPAWRFTGSNGMCLDSVVSGQVMRLMHNQCSSNSCFTVSAMLRLEAKGASGTFLSIRGSNGGVLDLVFKKNVQMRLRLKGPSDREAQWSRFYYEFTVEQWYHVAFVFCPATGMVSLYVNCNLIYRKNVNFPRSCFSHSGTVCIGKLAAAGTPDWVQLQGSVQNVRFLKGDSNSVCGRSHVNHDRATVAFLNKHVAALRTDLHECRKQYCVVNGTVHARGSVITQGCNTCTCLNGELSCTQPVCPQLFCPLLDQLPANPASGRCCPTCPLTLRSQDAPAATTEAPVTTPSNDCFDKNGVRYEHNGNVTYRDDDVYKCMPCQCQNRRIMCSNLLPSCPVLTCPPNQQHRKRGVCCKTCVKVDVCKTRKPCGDPRYGKCTNLPNNSYRCRCYLGNRMNSAGVCEPVPVTASPQWWHWG